MTLPKLHVAPSRLEQLLPARSRGLAFGIPALDRLLPAGLPRGQITTLDAPLGSGGTALLLALAETTLRADEGVALVDAARSLAPQAAAHLATLGKFWVIRPRGTESAWWCADVLLRTGAFGLVAIDQANAPARNVALRLQRLARHRGTAGHGLWCLGASVRQCLVFRLRSRRSGRRRRVARATHRARHDPEGRRPARRGGRRWHCPAASPASALGGSRSARWLLGSRPRRPGTARAGRHPRLAAARTLNQLRRRPRRRPACSSRKSAACRASSPRARSPRAPASRTAWRSPRQRPSPRTSPLCRGTASGSRAPPSKSPPRCSPRVRACRGRANGRTGGWADGAMACGGWTPPDSARSAGSRSTCSGSPGPSTTARRASASRMPRSPPTPRPSGTRSPVHPSA